MARPTDYTPELLEKAKAYVAAYDAAHATGEYKELPRLYPSIADLALTLDISRETVYAWAKEKPEFSDIVNKVMTHQESILSIMGLSGTFNASITKLMLTKHGYTDRQDVTSDGKALPQPILTTLPHETDTDQ